MRFLSAVDPLAAGGAVSVIGIVVTVFGYLLKELHRKDDGVWRIVREERRRTAEERYYRRAAERDAAHWRQTYVMECQGMTREEAERLFPMPAPLVPPEGVSEAVGG